MTNSRKTESKVEVVTQGCRLNAFESEVIRKHAQAAGLAKDTIIVNTCAVTAEAERQARQAVRRAKRENPEAEIVVTGCAAQINPGQFADMVETDRVVGNVEKMEATTWNPLRNDQARINVNDIMSVTETAGHLVDGFVEHTRAFVQVQQGCDHRCTFCIIPFGRGNSRSVPAGQVVQQITQLVDSGVKEVVLTGVDISSWGGDLPGTPPLGNLVKRILKLVPDLPRLRLSSIDSVEIDKDLIDTLATEPRLMPHFHLSLQAGDDMILKRMKRRHLREDAVRICQELRAARPDVVFGADLIAGFPTETDDMFQNSLKLIQDCGLTYLHVFPYSERDGTPAANMPPVEVKTRKARAAELRGAGEVAQRTFYLSKSGQSATILMEKNNIGRTEHFVPVEIPNASVGGIDLEAGTLISVILGDSLTSKGNLTGTLA